ncbi:MAG: hypothetical protein OEZ29_01365 [Candidatus Bathyarchaeota archaeon]|nr:hypothetical protein [Candidatus Bathyarchaeota archaeon]MDH5779226.1 hypothetical protein [Candidatus Bathyarchaeota archaeon]
MSETLLGVFIGGLIGIVTTLVIEIFREYRWREEREIRRKKSTIEYYRRLFDPLSPFLALHSQLNHIMGGAVSMQIERPKEQKQANEIRALLPKFLTAYDDFREKGYAALFPKDLKDKILSFGTKIALLNAELKEKPRLQDWNGAFQLIVDALKLGDQVVSRIRELLDVESLD